MISFIIPVLLFATGILAPPQMKVVDAYKAREIRKSDVWINSAPLTLKSLRGKVVVIDFWAFDCEPCIEAMPHIQQLYQKYGPEGLVVIGVHTPRAEYEKDVTKLRDAITKMGIKFPVVVDDQQKIFRDYLCDLWPSQFVVDGNGVVRYSHGGVGRYDDLEQVVQQLLNVQRGAMFDAVPFSGGTR
jgi:thiol-disulfide isomerase/thioredoxin